MWDVRIHVQALNQLKVLFIFETQPCWKKKQRPSQNIPMVSTTNTITNIINDQLLTISVVCFGTYSIRI